MALFDSNNGLGTSSGGIQGFGSDAINSVAGGANKLLGTVANLSGSSGLLSKLRSLNLPAGGEITGFIKNTQAQFAGSDADTDWRVRLSIPNNSVFSGSQVLQPLRSAGGLVFPYTPQIAVSTSANYDEQALIHQNYPFYAYQNSKVDRITISAPFAIEDAVQAQYWIAAVHFLRSATKMFSGDTPNQGNPPPISYFNGYGEFVFKNVPVVVTSFTLDLPKDVNYISTQASAGFGNSRLPGLGNSNGISDLINQVARTAGPRGAIDAAKNIASLGNIGSLGSNLSKNLASGLLGKTTAGQQGMSYVPTSSTLNISLQPIYSRESMRKFNLQKFVNGEYVKNNVGYL